MSAAAIVQQTPSGVRLEVRAIPRSPRARIDGVRDGRLVVRVTAPPVDQAANDAVVAVLADALDVARSAIHIVAGRTSRNKSVSIDRADAGAVRLRLGI